MVFDGQAIPHTDRPGRPPTEVPIPSNPTQIFCHMLWNSVKRLSSSLFYFSKISALVSVLLAHRQLDRHNHAVEEQKQNSIQLQFLDF
jgi:hypothetical protein